MYDDLARTQNPTPLEWFVVHAVIPSILVTVVLHWPPTAHAAPQPASTACLCSLAFPVGEPFPGPAHDRCGVRCARAPGAESCAVPAGAPGRHTNRKPGSRSGLMSNLWRYHESRQLRCFDHDP